MSEQKKSGTEEATVIPFPTSSAGHSESPEPVTVREALGDVLREERHEQKRTLSNVAKDAAVSLPYLSEIERGRKDVSSEVFESITSALELEPAEVLERVARRLRASSYSGPTMSSTMFLSLLAA